MRPSRRRSPTCLRGGHTPSRMAMPLLRRGCGAHRRYLVRMARETAGSASPLPLVQRRPDRRQGEVAAGDGQRVGHAHHAPAPATQAAIAPRILRPALRRLVRGPARAPLLPLGGRRWPHALGSDEGGRGEARPTRSPPSSPWPS